MNGRVSKKIRKVSKKYAKANWLEYVRAVEQWPFKARLRLCWHIIRAKSRKEKKR